MAAETQVGEFLDNTKTAIAAAEAAAPAPDTGQPAAAGTQDATAPGEQLQVPFSTPLSKRLTRDQEQKMLDHAFTRFRQICNESGRDQTVNPTWWMNLAPSPNLILASQGLLPANTFLGKRARFEATFYNDVSWRPWTMGPDNIFMSSNLVVPLSRRIARQMIARAKAAFFGSKPWFSVDPAPEPASDVDDELALRIERFCRFKLKETDSQTDKERAIERALVLGECAVKTNYVVRDQVFDTEAVVLMDVEGQPVMGADGKHITPEDKWTQKPMVEGGQPQSFLKRITAIPQMIQQRTFSPTVEVLARDGTTQKPDSPIWQKVDLDRQRQVLFEGARSEVIFYKDFGCPLTAQDVQVADCVFHLYDKPVMEFVDLAVKRGMVDTSTAGRLDATKRITALIQKLSDNDTSPKAAVSSELRPNENFSPIPSGQQGSPVAEFVEFYLWFDPFGDGIARNIMLIADRKNRVPVFYDYVTNVTTDGLRPIEIVRINPIEGRWYGLGIMELFECYQTATDLMVNRWNFSQSRSGRVDFWQPNMTQEGDRDPNLKMNWGGVYTLKPGMKAEDACKAIYLTDTKFEQIHEMIQFFIQLAMNESGVSMANDDQAAGMQSAKLATGIINVQQSGDELFKPVVDDLRGPLTRLLNREIDVTLANLNPQEVFTYLEGDTMGVDSLTPDDVRGLKFKVTIELTTQKNQQSLAVAAQCTALVEKFYLLTPEVQARAAPFYRSQIRALDPHCDVEHTIVPQTPPPPAPPPPEPVKAALAISAKIEQLTPQERIQAFKEIGIQSTGEAVPQPEVPAKKGPGGAKLGDAGPGGSTPFSAQLSQAPHKRTP